MSKETDKWFLIFESSDTLQEGFNSWVSSIVAGAMVVSVTDPEQLEAVVEEHGRDRLGAVITEIIKDEELIVKQVMEKLFGNESARHEPVFVYTADSSPDLRDHWEKEFAIEGTDGYFLKGQDLHLLAKKLQEIRGESDGGSV